MTLSLEKDLKFAYDMGVRRVATCAYCKATEGGLSET